MASSVARSTPSNVRTIWLGSAPGATRKSVLELAVASVVLEVDARVDADGPHAPERRDVRRPGSGIVAAIVVGLAREGLRSGHGLSRLAAKEADPDFAGRRAALGQCEPRARGTERNLVALAAGCEPDPAVELAVVPLEGEGQAGEQVAARAAADGRGRVDAWLGVENRGRGRRRRGRADGGSVGQGQGGGARRRHQGPAEQGAGLHDLDGSSVWSPTRLNVEPNDRRGG